MCVSDGSLSDCETIPVAVVAPINEVETSDSVSNSAPVLDPIGDKSATAASELAFTVTASDLDVPAQPLTFNLSGEPTGASITTDGRFTWTPDTAGEFAFDICVCDGSLSGCKTITITVSGEIPLPVASDDEYSIDEDTELTDPVPGVLGNDNDPEGHSLSAILISGPQHGRLQLNADGSFRYCRTAITTAATALLIWQIMALLKAIQRRSK